VCNHHFLLPEDGTAFQFLAGEYQLEVFASLVGSAKTLRLLLFHCPYPSRPAHNCRAWNVVFILIGARTLSVTIHMLKEKNLYAYRAFSLKKRQLTRRSTRRRKQRGARELSVALLR
jgi:hypothetical protein